MKLQLFLDNEEVELKGTETFPLNQTYENLYNPSDIIVEYSKSINIPVTSRNNRILGNSYRLDRAIISGGDKNIGIYLDPSKRIPIKLIYNNSILLDGYAKFVSATSSPKEDYYTLNLFGVLGDIFQKLKKVVPPNTQLDEELGEEYILNDYSKDYEGNEIMYDSSFVSESWSYDYRDLDDPAEKNVAICHIYGAAPSYCGYYADFDPKRVQISEDGSSKISDELSDSWKIKYCSQKGYDFNKLTDAQKEEVEEKVDALDPEGFVGDGLYDYQIGDYRSYRQRPFIYFNKLMYMFRKKITEISDYKLELDQNWFNANNPYWAHMCYMFDFLQKEGQPERTGEAFDGAAGSVVRLWQDSSADTLFTTTTTKLKGTTTGSTLILDPFTIAVDMKTEKPIQEDSRYVDGIKIKLRDQVGIKVSVTVGDSTQYVFASLHPYDQQISNILYPSGPGTLTEDNYVQIKDAPDNLVEGCKNNPTKDECFFRIDMPSLSFTSRVNPGNTVTIQVDYANWRRTQPYGSSFYSAMDSNENAIIPIAVYHGYSEPVSGFKGYITPYVLPATCKIHWNNLPVGLKTFHTQETPLFDIILEYTKMFGLVWDVDYPTKTIKLQRRESMFKNYKIIDWGSKLDKSQSFVVEPIAFPTQYVKFGYDDVDGYRYSSYKTETGYNYGEKILKTNYNFNTGTSDVFEGIKPGMSSNRNYVSYYDCLHWDLEPPLVAKTDFIPRLEISNEENTSTIDACRWCMRSPNVGDTDTNKLCFITDDTTLQITSGESYYIDPRAIQAGYLPGIYHYGLPVFTQVWQDPITILDTYGLHYSCLFNTPRIDYTKDQLFSKASDKTIYNLFWKNYINERYNIQNKKITAFFHLSAVDYDQFTFKNLVRLDNQLFMVNKIIDFDPTTNKSTKCELIQITNMDNYTKPIEEFKPIVYGGDSLVMENGKYVIYHEDGYFGFSIYVRCHPEPDIELNITYTDGSYNWDPIVIEDIEGGYGDNITYVGIGGYLGDYGIRDAEFEIVIRSGENETVLPFSVMMK